MAEPARDISKQEAARRELEMAIKMLFADDDAVCIHLLASSAETIVRDVCRTGGLKATEDDMADHIRLERLDEVRKKFRAAYNYFKHADRDAEILLDHFDEQLNDFVIIRAVYDYEKVYAPITPTMAMFRAWFVAVYPDCVNWEEPAALEMLKHVGVIANLQRGQQKRRGLELLADVAWLERWRTAHPDQKG